MNFRFSSQDIRNEEGSALLVPIPLFLKGGVMAQVRTIRVVLIKSEVECVINRIDFNPAIHRLIDVAVEDEKDNGVSLDFLRAHEAIKLIKEVSKEELDALEEQEKNGKDRTSVLDAIDRRREEPEEE